MNVIKSLIIQQALNDKFTEKQIEILKNSNLDNYDLYKLYKKIYKGEYKIEDQKPPTL